MGRNFMMFLYTYQQVPPVIASVSLLLIQPANIPRGMSAFHLPLAPFLALETFQSWVLE
jgi:hypothetical protein